MRHSSVGFRDKSAYCAPLRLASLATVSLGLLNNASFCIVLAAAQNLATSFQAEDLMTLFNLALLLAGVSGTLINAKFLLRYTPRVRVIALLLLMTSAYLLVAFSTLSPNRTGFVIALIGSLLAGMAQSIGECTIVSCCKSFPSQVLAGWGAGTGLAGLVGTGVYLALINFGVTNAIVFVCLAPTSVVYYAIFLVLSKFDPTTWPDIDRSERKGLITNSDDTLKSDDVTEIRPAATMTFNNVRVVIRCAGPVVWTMVVVYFCEYAIYPGLVDRDTKFTEKSFIQENAYILSWMAYNVGVTLSRVSVSCVKIRRVWILCALQAVNMTLWFFEVSTRVVRGLGDDGFVLLLISMIWVGLMGGATYSNCMHLMNTSPDIPDSFRELGVNVTFGLLNLGIIAATLMSLVLANTAFSLENLYPEQFFPNGTQK